MKKGIVLSAILTLFFLTAMPVQGQENCKVLMPRIADSYTGDCKQGLADGKGEAFGIDQYKGTFRKGYPDGEGTYVWQTGEKYEGQWKKGLRDGKGAYAFKSDGKDSLMAGVWKEDKFLGAEVLPPYVIQYRNSIGRVTCMKMGEKPVYVRYKFSRSGDTSLGNISNITMTYSSGSETWQSTFIGLENVEFPFEGRLRFNAPNAFNTAMLNCDLKYLINEPGAWVVTIFY